jgi:pimeloyl-ACP methyl ester carboxylesterase
LVFLHEGLGSIGQWKAFPARLAERTGCGALVYDRWGYGGSEPLPPPYRRPVDFMEREGRETVPELLDSLDIREAVLVGHSDGASIALVAAGLGDSRIRAVVSIAAHVFVEAVSLKSIAAIRGDWDRTDLRARLARYHPHTVDGAFLGWAETWLDPAFRDWAMTGLLGAIACPVLAIQGTEDAYGTEAQVDAIVAGCGGPAERLMVRGIGHAPHLEAPEIVLDAAARFIRSALAPAAELRDT